jgi:hypothetical protein
MSNPQAISQFEEKNRELTEKIAHKTIEGKIRWTRQPGRLFASISGDLSAEFTIPESTPISFLRGLKPEDWKTFQVKKGTTALVFVENQGPLITAMTGESAFFLAIQILFQSVISQATEEVKKAINIVDEI